MKLDKINLIEKIKRNLILFILLILGIFTVIAGVYYNKVRETKQIFHYSFKDEPNKKYKIFFQRSSDDDSNRTTIKELFYYKPGTIVNFTPDLAYFIKNLPDNQNDKIYSYNFRTKESQVIYDNPENKFISDLYLYQGNLVFISDEKLFKLNLDSGEVEQLAERLNNTLLLNKNLPFSYEYNEFVNITNDKVTIKYDSCKFQSDKCVAPKENYYLTYNLNTKEIQKFKDSEIDQNLLKATDFFGTNKIFRRGVNSKYEKDKGVANYNLRLFTQF